jgi:hypothetical protein
MADLPLVVTRPDGKRFFDPDERDALTGDRLWVEFDAELGAAPGSDRLRSLIPDPGRKSDRTQPAPLTGSDIYLYIIHDS